MIISPEIIIKNEILTEVSNLEEQVQQNGVDLTLKSIFKLSGENILKHENRNHCNREEVELLPDGTIYLPTGVYEVNYNEKFNIPNGMCAIIMTRSTVVRGGNFIASGLYDAGFNNYGGGVLHVNVPIVIELGVRLAQVIFFQADHGKMYEGIYNHNLTANENPI